MTPQPPRPLDCGPVLRKEHRHLERGHPLLVRLIQPRKTVRQFHTNGIELNSQSGVPLLDLADCLEQFGDHPA